MNAAGVYAGTPTLNLEYTLHGVGPAEVDPLEIGALLWPDDKWASYQRKIVYSVWNNRETQVKAGNKLGKDWMGGFIATVFFLTRHPCRIVTTSAKEGHLRVLWGEIGERIRRSSTPLEAKKGGPLIINHQDIRKLVDGDRCPLSYLTGMVAGADTIASMQGHHIALTGDGIPRTMFMCDEASSVNHEYYRMARSWFNRAYIFGNPWPCQNFFYYAFKGQPGTHDKGGDIWKILADGTILSSPPEKPRPGQGFQRKTFTLRAQDSPNVRFGEAQERLGIEPTDAIKVPGLKPYGEYIADRRQMDAISQSVSLDGEFYEGGEVRMFPSEWILNSNRLASEWRMTHPGTKKQRTRALGIGIDSAQGGDDTAMCAVDECGVLEIVSKKTPNTNVIVGEVEAFVRKWNCPWESVFFDIGGGGKQHADRMRANGRNIRTIVFNAGPSDDVDILHREKSDRKRSQDIVERRQVYKNKRAEMYGNLREVMDPTLLALTQEQRDESFKAIMGIAGLPVYRFYGFAIPRGIQLEPFVHADVFAELNRQMGPIPLTYTEEGMIYLIPKHPRDREDDRPNLSALLGCSPDELDACVLAVHAMLRPPAKPMYI